LLTLVCSVVFVSLQGNTIITDPSFENHRWITPARGDPDWQPSYQDFSRLVGNAHVVYNQNRSLATVTVSAPTKFGAFGGTPALSSLGWHSAD
jgi:hypothetical protein